MKILLFGAKDLRTAAQKGAVTRAVAAALGRHGKRSGELCVVFVDDKKIRKVNREFLGHDYATDVIAFRYPADPHLKGADAPFGDIYVGLGVARRQARELGHGLFEELLTLCVHGALHLVGYDDKRPAAKKRMFARQDRIVRAFLRNGAAASRR